MTIVWPDLTKIKKTEIWAYFFSFWNLRILKNCKLAVGCQNLMRIFVLNFLIYYTVFSDIVCKSYSRFTFSYDVGKKNNISKCSARKSKSDFDYLRPVCKFLESSNTKRKKVMLKFQFFWIFVKYGQTTYSRSISVTK